MSRETVSKPPMNAPLTSPPINAGTAAPPSTSASMSALVRDHLHPQLAHFFDRLAREKEALHIDGVAALRSDDKFLPGKIALGLGHVLLNTPPDDPRLDAHLTRYREIADLTVGHDNHSWGIYYYLLMLVRLREAGLLDRAISPATLARLRGQLDWRSFVREDTLQLIDLPTNYYGVAFSVARLRELLGWDDAAPAQRLLAQMLAHYERYSAGFGFSDETAGQGRFDRYSVLLIAEVCQRFVQTGLTVPPQLRALLAKSARLVLTMAHPAGIGFSFGRSIGPYGDSAMAEILSVAAHLDVLDAEEKLHAYRYSVACLQRYLSFWFNPRIQSVDMWGQGRRTDGYRARHRILGENFSLIHQYLSCHALWLQAGFADEPGDADALRHWIQQTQPPFALTRFASGAHERALAVWRDGDDVWSLPLVNGGSGQHDNSPYHPIPFCEDIVAGIADSGADHPQLTYRLVLADGSVLLPTCFARGIASGTNTDGSGHWLSYHQDECDRLGQPQPQPDARLAIETRYDFAPGRITRTDRLIPAAPLRLRELSLDFFSFSSGPEVNGTEVQFAEGRVSGFHLHGLPLQRVQPTEALDPFKSPSGPMKTWLRYAVRDLDLNQPLTLRWSLQTR